jgi:enoyl-CoA hydratase/carnithine racemase
MTEQQELIAEIREGVGVLTLNRPERRNALSPDLLLKIHLRLEAWAKTDEVRVVIFTGGGGKAFSSGYDITAIPTEVTEEMKEILKKHNPLELALSSVKNFPYPTIAMLNGYAFGAGLNLAVCCDIRIAADNVKAGMPPAKLGLVYHPEGLRQFVEVLGMPRTREIFLSGKTYEGAALREMGLADHLEPRSGLEAAVFALAKEIAANAPLSLRGTKRILNMIGSSLCLSEAEWKEAETLITEAFNSDDLKEGQTAFLEKRKPRFTGQ